MVSPLLGLSIHFKTRYIRCLSIHEKKKEKIQIQVVDISISKTALIMVLCDDPFACVIHSHVKYVILVH